jgi:hypothetical protein
MKMKSQKCIWVGTANSPGIICPVRNDENAEIKLAEHLKVAQEKFPNLPFMGKVFDSPTDADIDHWVHANKCKSIGGEMVDLNGFDSKGYPSVVLSGEMNMRVHTIMDILRRILG